MIPDSQQERLLRELNDINRKLDELFFHIDDTKISDRKAMLVNLDLTHINFTLDKIHSKLR